MMKYLILLRILSIYNVIVNWVKHNSSLWTTIKNLTQCLMRCTGCDIGIRIKFSTGKLGDN